jgi:putative ABC transport system permease protein
VASISLLVGGIGIMNIMLVTVTERTREIGVRKAIGAKDRDILRQFLFEAIFMSGIGGVIGVAVGVGAAKAVSAATSFTTVLQPQSMIMAMLFAVAVGVFFGYYPARRAAMLNPIDALRYE